ncbi:metallophosphoesterase [uncultured Oxalicibacterium sp.]|uniref:metallophosphoesterase n=1 Tax=uncultured Oxalicibacterium sp. TaxID=1168540 RepID=UPI0025F5B509|nr:metallophosphoesterase [uncultured Oxalicibacterium sp.]
MRVLVLSDLHHEVWRKNAPKISWKDPAPELVVLAGDIDQGDAAIRWAAECFASIPVVYVGGNHEAYGLYLEDAEERLRSTCASTANMHFLNCAEFFLDKYRILGATLWTDFKLFGVENQDRAMAASIACVMDYKRIRLRSEGGRLLNPSDTITLHNLQKAWLEQRIAEPFEGKTIVVTHMAPSIRSISPKYINDLSSAAFASNLDALADKVDVWIHGHTHDSFDYSIGKCRVICNPCGYINRSGGTENFAFSSNFIIEI